MSNTGTSITSVIRRGSCNNTFLTGGIVLMCLFIMYDLCTRVPAAHNCMRAVEGFQDRISHVIREELVRKKTQYDATLPIIYVITPTYKRLEQIPELTRLGQTLMNVPNIHWIVADDATETNPEVIEYLDFCGIPHTYLLTPMPRKYKNQTKAKPKGVANRNGGLKWVREHATEGVVYFADDDNAYDIRLFTEIRYTKRVSMFPVGLVTGFGLSSPVLKDGKFSTWYDGWIGGRKFPVDMAGFAVNVQYLLQVKDAFMPYAPGYEEDGFLKKLKIEPEELEFLAEGCTKIYVWHTQTKKNKPSDNKILESKFDGTNLRHLQQVMTIDPTTKRKKT